MKIGSLFAGIGGFDLAARWMGWETAWVSEIEPYASRILAKQFPEAPNLGDITKITNAPPVDMLCGGFPCQDISLAGKGAGLEGARSGLWYHYARLIEEIRPRYVVAENVSALRSRGLDKVLGTLAALGYDAEWHCITAAHVGAPHRRDRIWIIASPAGSAHGSILGNTGSEPLDRVQHGSGTEGRGEAPPEGAVDAGHPGGGDDADVADTCGCRCTGCRTESAHEYAGAGDQADGRSGWWMSEPDVGRVAHGVPARMDRLRCLGNAIVPQVAYLIFQAIAAHEARR